MLGKMKKQQGVSLVELMIGIGIALILLTGVLTVMLRVSSSGADSVQATRLNQQMRETMDFVTKELQRAGYVDWRAAWGTGTGTHVFADVNTDGNVDTLDYYQAVLPVVDQFGDVTLQKLSSGAGTGVTGSCPPQADCDCVLYSYDLDEDGEQSADQFELFGFRRSEDANGRGRIQMRTSGTHDCTSNGWTEISDDNVDITRFALNISFSTATGTDSHSTVYELSNANNWKWSSGDYRSGIGTGANECMPSLGTDTDNFDENDVLCLHRRSILVELEGQLTDDPGVTVELEDRVKLKNDYLHSSP